MTTYFKRKTKLVRAIQFNADSPKKLVEFLKNEELFGNTFELNKMDDTDWIITDKKNYAADKVKNLDYVVIDNGSLEIMGRNTFHKIYISAI